MSPSQRTCQKCKNVFTLEQDDFDIHQKMQVPPPTFCPDCRMRRRFLWRNEYNLYRRKDAHTGEEIFAGFAPDVPAQIYEKEYWHSDAWDPLAYGKEYDFNRSFFEQFKELMYTVPWPSRSILRLINSDYCDQADDLKNCYLCFNVSRVEDSAYVVRTFETKNSFDLTQCSSSELCYEGVNINNCYRTFFSRDCESCNEVWFSERCISCTNCFGCVNLRNKSYCFLNQQLSREEYETRLKELRLDSWSGLSAAREKAESLAQLMPVKYYHGVRIVGSSGDYLRNVKNARYSFHVDGVEDAKYCQNIYFGGKDLYDYAVWGSGSSLMYECITCGEADYGCKFCFECWPACKNLEYSMFCRSSEDCFGCVGIRKKQHCILNKQYSPEAYRALRGKIIEQMNALPFRDVNGYTYSYGEFFPEEFSPFGYNETTLQAMHPLSKEEAQKEGYRWHDAEARSYETTVSAADLLDSINDATEKIVQDVIRCSSCEKPYRLIASEFEFLKKMGIPVPRACVNCRLAKRFLKLNTPDYHHRSCDCKETGLGHTHGPEGCTKTFETAYAPNRHEPVYCEECYNAATG